MTVQELHDALAPDERNLPIHADTEWECGSNVIDAAAIVAVTHSVRAPYEVVRPRCIMLLSRAISADQSEADCGVIERVVIAGNPE